MPIPNLQDIDWTALTNWGDALEGNITNDRAGLLTDIGMTQDMIGGDGGDIAKRYGLDENEYGDYFTPIREEMLNSATRGFWKDYEGFLKGSVEQQHGNKIEQIGLNRESSVNNARKGLLNTFLNSSRIGSKFVGSGASYKAKMMANEDARESNEIKMDLSTLSAKSADLAREKGLFGVEQDIVQKMADAKSSIFDWLGQQQQTALQIKQMKLSE